ncbi:MAG: hypothetical protein GX601_02740 [Anaerolineales bacterium]|nr:hypothetical protein [Anaerolineales bacterium]
MKRLRSDPILAFLPLLLLGLLGGAVVWLLGATLDVPWITYVASVASLGLIIALGICVLLLLWLRRWALGLALSVVWLVWYVVGLWNAPNRPHVLLYSILPAALFLIVGLWLAAGYVLPPSPESSRALGLRCLLSFLSRSNYPYYQVEDVKDEARRLVKRADASPIQGRVPGGGPGLVTTGPDYAVVVSDGLRFKGVQGPGLVLTDVWDRPVQTMDLREQLRSFTVQALTKDGIGVEAEVSVAFRVDRGDAALQPGEPVPYRKRAIFQAYLAQRLEHSEDEESSECRWDDLPQIAGRRALQASLATYTFDELYQPYGVAGREQEPRTQIAQQLARTLRASLDEHGIQVLAVSIDKLLAQDDETVLRQRIESWQARWSREIALIEADSQAERIRMVEEARAEAQSALILALGRRLEEMSALDQSVSAKEIAAWFLETLQETTRQPLVQQLLSQEATAMMEYVRARIEKPDA